MKAVLCHEPLTMSVIECEPPQRHAGEVMVRIRRVGLCGTDYHIYAGNQPYLSYPRVIGHELAGEVVEADPDAPFAAGDIVTINPYIPCGSCIACRNSKPNCCMFISVLGVHRDGGMCEFLSVPQAAVIPAKNLTIDQAAMVEFLAIGRHAVRRAGVQKKKAVLVVGAGPIGIATASFARMDGADVIIIDTSNERLAFARDQLGFSVLAADAETPERLGRQTGGEFFECVFDATGNIHAMRHGLSYVAHGGTYVLVSVVKEDLIFSDPEFHKRETTLLGSRNATAEDFSEVIARIADNSIPTGKLLTHRLNATEMPKLMPDLIARSGEVLKAMVSF